MKKCTLLFTSVFIAQLHAAQLGTVHIADPVLGNKTLTYEKINKYAVVEGDIILASMNEINKQGAVITRKISGTRWTHGVIPYILDEELPFANKLAILQAMDHWQQHSNLEFVELNSKNHDKYQDYIYFIPAEGTTCSSFVGRQGGEQIINLAPRCTTMNTVHEIGHALGMWHEQSRADRNSYVRIVWDNIEEDYKYNFLQQLSDGKDFGEYDYQSIMHYGPYSFSKNGLATIIPLQEGVEIGQRNQLSDKDIAAIKAMYPEL